MAFNPDALSFSAANALLLAEASEAVYSTEARARELMEERGLPEFRWIDLSGVFDESIATG